MKFFHLSDLHIGKQLHHYSLLEDQTYILRQIIEKARELLPDGIVIAGDIYDKAIPSAEAVALFDGFLTELSEIEPRIPVLLVAGNHDSPKRLEFVRSILKKDQIYIAGMPPKTPKESLEKVILTDAWGPVCFYLLPFIKPGYVSGVFPEEELGSYEEAVAKLLEREKVDESIRNVLVTHQFYTASGREPASSDSESIHVGGIDNIDVRVLEPFVYAAMGHIHRPQSMGRESYRYCGTPLAYSVSEKDDKKSLTVVTLREPGTAPDIECLPLAPLRRVCAYKGTLEELLEAAGEGNCGDYVSLTLTDEVMPYQPREQLERKYERILEIKVENTRTRRQAEEIREASMVTDPMELFGAFYRELQGEELDENQKTILRDVLEQVKED
ncbi:MAG: exonuclease SbcCD subunit D [Blautia sp.]|jgi:exonuclease SbcD